MVLVDTSATDEIAPRSGLATTCDDPPVACTLAPGAMDDRVAAWSHVLKGGGAGTRSVTAAGALRIELAHADIGSLAQLVAAEQQCCAFFSFAITVDRRGIALEVAAPEAAADLVTGLFGSAD